ncbi:MAG TPA: hypothetical protein DCY20_06530 [Firmicutes bacterium]|nr:hypothetical protein [Bacillota bacterium]
MRLTDTMKDEDYQWADDTNRLYKLEQYQDPYDQLFSEALGNYSDPLYITHLDEGEFKLSKVIRQLFKKKVKR